MRRKRNNKVKYLLTFAAILILTVTVVVVYYYLPRGSSTKPLASQYLNVVHTASIGEYDINNETIKIKVLGIKITPVLGNAHVIMLMVEDPGSDSIKTIDYCAAGEYLDIQFSLQGYGTVLNDEGKFPVEVGVRCREAEPEMITLFLDPEDITILPGG